MPRTKRTWLAIAAAAAIILGAIAIIAVGTGAYIIYTHTAAQFVDAAAADAQIAAQRALFAGQEPLIELRGVDTPLVHRHPDAPRREVMSLHVLSYDPRARKLVRAEVPGWLLRVVSAHGTIRLANLEMFNDDRDRVTLEDLERHGPGLIVEAQGRSRVLVWTE
ncbi:MAG TPA: hypothetical protein VGJ29_02000 [Vicinamibacterales bacterium]